MIYTLSDHNINGQVIYAQININKARPKYIRLKKNSYHQSTDMLCITKNIYGRLVTKLIKS